MIGWVIRIFAVVALLGVAAAVATPRGRLPLALRGLEKIVREDRGGTAVDPAARDETVSSGRKALAFLLVLAAIAVVILA